jgi:hypothetical protein
MEIEEIKKELQSNQRSHLKEREEEELEHLGTIRDREQKPNTAFTTVEETEIHQQRDQIYKLKEKTESTYQVTQIAIDNRLRLQKLQNMLKIKVIMKTAKEAMEEILDLNITELNHLIYAAETVITEEINGTGEYKLQTQRSKTPLWVRRIQGSINDIRKELSALVEIRRDKRKVMNINITRLLEKYNIEKTEELDQLKQKVSAKTRLLSRYRKRQNQYYQNKLFRTDSRKFYNCLRQTYPNLKNAHGKEEVEKFWRKIYGKKFNIMERRAG